MKPVYMATATLLIDEESPNVLTTKDMVALDRQGYTSYREYYQSQLKIITLKTIASQVFKKFHLSDSKEYKGAKEPVDKFLKTVKAEPVRDTRLMRLHVENPDPLLAADIANYIAELYVKRNMFYISRTELMNLLKNEYLKLESKLSEYSKVYKEAHPKMIRLRQEMSGLIAKIEETKAPDFIFDRDIDEISASSLRGLKANNVSIQDTAGVPKIPVRPKKRLNIIIAMIIGFLGGIGLAFFQEYLNDTVKSGEDVSRIVAWPLLVNVPKFSGNLKPLGSNKSYILTKTKPNTRVAETYKALRTSIAFSSTEERPLKTILVSSPGPQEGKTSTICNLAITMAQNRKRVVLIDADMRKPRLHEIFKLKNNIGLSSFISGQSDQKNLIQQTDVDNLSLITSGPYTPNPSELISTHKMEELVKLLEDKFDYILFDTPPIAMVTDTVILSRVSDGIIMVLECDKTSRRILPQINKVLSDTKAKVVGFVLNKSSVRSAHYYNYSYYSDSS
ncbi:MAG: polysaccharide biosynthesis tyrosine autokinase [Candidatus Omnitrophica bacterium]|nr:polysaccharide biosynthesis tyrosine autokinase [Candidatus Omnitrophota bacterium]